MYTLIVRGARRAILAVHRLDSYTDLTEMLAVYHALGFDAQALTVEEQRDEQAA